MISGAIRLAVSLACAAAVLGAGAWIGGVRASGLAPSVRRASDGRDSRRTEREIPVGDALIVSDQPMELSLFYTADPPFRVAQFYADAFRARGLLPVLAADLGHVSVFDPASGRQRFVSALARPDRQTLVLLGTVVPRRPPRFLRGPADPSFPVPPENRAFVGFRSSDGGSEAESAQFVTALAPHEVGRFYRQALAGEGYAERRESSEGLLSFARPGATISVAVQGLDGEQGSAAFVTRIEGAP